MELAPAGALAYPRRTLQPSSPAGWSWPRPDPKLAGALLLQHGNRRASATIAFIPRRRQFHSADRLATCPEAPL